MAPVTLDFDASDLAAQIEKLDGAARDGLPFGVIAQSLSAISDGTFCACVRRLGREPLPRLPQQP